MLYFATPLLRNNLIRNPYHHRTSRQHHKSSDDEPGGHPYRTANTFLCYKVSFGCFVFLRTSYRCREPPTSNCINLTKLQFGVKFMKKLFKHLRKLEGFSAKIKGERRCYRL